jgi:predicted enzyme related to lactoylglutathione lyase
MKVTGIDTVYYTVSDFDRSKTFYTDLLGAEPAMTWPGRLAEWEFADGNSFGIYRSEESTVNGRSGSAMFAVDDVARAAGEAKARGVTMHDDGNITDTPFCHMAFGEDPEGNQFILHRRKENAPAPA